MKIITPFVHGVIDYGVVLFLLLSPSLFNITGLPGILIYALSAIHLFLSITTGFKLSIFKLIPFKIHGIIELLVSIVLVVMPWIFGFAEVTAARNFYIIFGVVVFLTWLLTDYKEHKASPQKE